jgi:hypothetical protein
VVVGLIHEIVLIYLTIFPLFKLPLGFLGRGFEKKKY